jgi:hypothetical protein
VGDNTRNLAHSSTNYTHDSGGMGPYMIRRFDMRQVHGLRVINDPDIRVL